MKSNLLPLLKLLPKKHFPAWSLEQIWTTKFETDPDRRSQLTQAKGKGFDNDKLIREKTACDLFALRRIIESPVPDFLSLCSQETADLIVAHLLKTNDIIKYLYPYHDMVAAKQQDDDLNTGCD